MVSWGKYLLTFPIQMTAQTYIFTLTCYDTPVYFNPLKPTHLIHQKVWHSQILLSAHTICTYIVIISERTAISALYNMNWLVFITKMKSVYCAVWSGSLNKTIYTSCLKGQSKILRNLYNAKGSQPQSTTRTKYCTNLIFIHIITAFIILYSVLFKNCSYHKYEENKYCLCRKHEVSIWSTNKTH
jgi:hypothetical protein